MFSFIKFSILMLQGQNIHEFGVVFFLRNPLVSVLRPPRPLKNFKNQYNLLSQGVQGHTGVPQGAPGSPWDPMRAVQVSGSHFQLVPIHTVLIHSFCVSGYKISIFTYLSLIKKYRKNYRPFPTWDKPSWTLWQQFHRSNWSYWSFFWQQWPACNQGHTNN